MIVSRPRGEAAFATAQCSSGDSPGDLVYITGPKVGNDFAVTKADVTHYTGVPILAVITTKLSSTRAVIQFHGEVKGQYSGLTPGRVYFVGPNSRPSITPPAPVLVGSKAYVQSIGVSTDPSVLLLNPSNNVIVRVNF